MFIKQFVASFLIGALIAVALVFAVSLHTTLREKKEACESQYHAKCVARRVGGSEGFYPVNQK